MHRAVGRHTLTVVIDMGEATTLANDLPALVGTVKLHVTAKTSQVVEVFTEDLNRTLFAKVSHVFDVPRVQH